MGNLNKSNTIASDLKNEVSSCLGTSFFGNFYIFNGKKYPVKLISVGVNSDTINQMSVIDLKFEYVILDPYQCSNVAINANAQHKGLVIENFTANYNTLSSQVKFNNSNLKIALDTKILFWEKSSKRKSLETFVNSWTQWRVDSNKESISNLRAII
jgi:hypothetical protein